MPWCCTARKQGKSFREVYCELALHLHDEHILDMIERYRRAAFNEHADHIRFATAEEILAEIWPFRSNRSCDADPELHEEFVRIETSWASHVRFNGLQAACTKASVPDLLKTWTAAAQQPFSFPTAVLLLHAAAATPTTNGVMKLDARCWKLLRALCMLAEPKLAAYGRGERLSRHQAENSLALKWQRDAIEGVGFGRTQRLLGRTSRAPHEKLRRGSSAFRGGPRPLEDKVEADALTANQKRRASMLETDGLPALVPASAIEVQDATQTRPAAALSAKLSRRVARRNISSSADQCLKEAPPVERHGGGFTSMASRSWSSRRRQRTRAPKVKLVPRAERPSASHVHVHPVDGSTSVRPHALPSPSPSPRRLPGPHNAKRPGAEHDKDRAMEFVRLAGRDTSRAGVQC